MGLLASDTPRIAPTINRVGNKRPKTIFMSVHSVLLLEPPANGLTDSLQESGLPELAQHPPRRSPIQCY